MLKSSELLFIDYCRSSFLLRTFLANSYVRCQYGGGFPTLNSTVMAAGSVNEINNHLSVTNTGSGFTWSDMGFVRSTLTRHATHQ